MDRNNSIALRVKGRYVNNRRWIITKGKYLVLPILITGLTAFVSHTSKPTELFSQPEQSFVVRASESNMRNSAPTPAPHHVEYTIDQAVDYIWSRESTRGKNNPPYSLASNCYAKGLWNELGFGGMQNPKCFKDKAEGWKVVTEWIEKRHDDKTLNISGVLCTYRFGDTGKLSEGGDSCEYGKTFIDAHTREN